MATQITPDTPSYRNPDLYVTPVVIGADEVGRGCVLGPVVVGAVANPLGYTNPRVRDSKKISREKSRQEIAAVLQENALWFVTSVPATAIDEKGLSHSLDVAYLTALTAMVTKVQKTFPGRPIEILLDGMGIAAVSHRFNTPDIKVTATVKADDKFFEVSAASIIAKVARDNWVHQLVAQHPTLAVYHLDENKGYGSEQHVVALLQHGMTEWHRHSACRTLLRHAQEKAARATHAVTSFQT